MTPVTRSLHIPLFFILASLMYSCQGKFAVKPFPRNAISLESIGNLVLIEVITKPLITFTVQWIDQDVVTIELKV